MTSINSKPTILSTPILKSKCYQYADEVLTGKETACIKVKQSCQRFINDLEATGNPKYKWAFDLEKAYRPILFIEKFLRPSKGDYDRMELLPWQHFVEGNLYGWIDKKTGFRRFREGLVLVGSGNGKSTLVTGIAAFAASKDGERGAEVYTLANSEKQARIIVGECGTQIKNSPLLDKHFRVTRDGIFYDATNSWIKALATDSDTIDGLNVHLAIFDEEQDYADYSLINRIKPKMKKRRQPMMIFISTLGTVIDGPLMDHYQLGTNILAELGAISQRAADRVFIYIAEIDENDDPANIDCWKKANPSLGKLLMLDDLIDEWDRVQPIPAERSNFINKQLNVFTMVDELSFLDVETIKKNNTVKPLKELRGQRCYGGFDMSETEDFTSACLEFPLPDNWFFILSHSWVPEKKVQVNREKLDWTSLEHDGLLTIVRGEYVDHMLVYEWFAAMRELYKIDSIGYDPAKAFDLVQLMQKNAFTLNPVRQGELTLTAPLDNMKERFLDGKFIHNNNRMYNWYLGNVKLTKRGPNATYLPTKQNKYRKIDGFAAHLDAHTEYMRKNQTVIPTDKRVATVIRLGGS
jgi:phage terminase large subunit-like protein